MSASLSRLVISLASLGLLVGCGAPDVQRLLGSSEAGHAPASLESRRAEEGAIPAADESQPVAAAPTSADASAPAATVPSDAAPASDALPSGELDAAAPGAEEGEEGSPAEDAPAPAPEATEPPPAEEPAAPVSTTYALQLTSMFDLEPTFASSFIVNETYELYFAMDVPTHLRGSHTLTLFVSAPGGFSYQRMDVKFATDTAAGPGQQQAEKLPSGGYRVWASMPVAGTMIEQYGLVGTWDVAAYIDSVPAAQSVPFDLL